MLFWINHRPNIDYEEIDSDVQAILFYVSSQMTRVQRKILELTPELQKSIHGLINYFIINDYCFIGLISKIIYLIFVCFTWLVGFYIKGSF